jgi:hypothetical protein
MAVRREKRELATLNGRVERSGIIVRSISCKRIDTAPDVTLLVADLPPHFEIEETHAHG